MITRAVLIILLPILLGACAPTNKSVGNGAQTDTKSNSNTLNKDAQTMGVLTREQIETRIKTLHYFLRLQDGIAPESDLKRFKTLRNDFIGSSTRLLNYLNQTSSYFESRTSRDKNDSLSQNCFRYYTDFYNALEDFEKNEKELTKIDDVETQTLLRVRLEISMGFLGQFATGSRDGVDGGFINHYLHSACPHENGDELNSQIQQFQTAIGHYWTARFGVDPVLDARVLNQLSESEKDEALRNSVKQVGFLIGTTALSMAFWELAVVRGAALIGTATTLASIAVTTVRGVLIVGEAMGMTLLYRDVFPESYRSTQVQSMSEWNDVLVQSEEFFELPLKSASHYAPFMLEADKTRLNWLKEFLVRRGGDLANAEKNWGSLQTALDFHLQLLQKQDLK